MGISWLPSYYSGAEIKCYIRYGEYDLLEVQDVEFSINRSATPGGAGMGHPRNRYHKLGTPKGEWKISKHYLNYGPQADLFAQLIAGTTALQSATAPAGVMRHTMTYRIVSVLYVRLATGGMLYEGTHYLLDYINQAVVFLTPLTANATIVYMTDETAKASDALHGVHRPFVFDVEWRERDSGTVLKRLRGCMPYELSSSSGEDEEPFSEDLNGHFLACEGRGVGAGICPSELATCLMLGTPAPEVIATYDPATVDVEGEVALGIVIYGVDTECD